MRVIIPIFLMGALAAITPPNSTQAREEHRHDMHMQQMKSEPAVADPRTLVHFPEPLRIHTLANMRDHLLALAEIQETLAREQFERAGEIAEQRLGMSSMELHGAHEVGPYMPKEMAAIGTSMHRAASRFAVAASDAAVGGEINPALAALADVTRQCVACHNGYRVQ